MEKTIILLFCGCVYELTQEGTEQWEGGSSVNPSLCLNGGRGVVDQEKVKKSD